MAFSLKQQRDIESDIHEQLYTNILILTLEYPTTKDFNGCFKKDMFVKNNKHAFQHVMHFLLNVLNPVQFRQKIVWPILDIKMETQFRNEVMKFLNQLNSTNKDTGIPLIMTSHLISPGGYKFTEFMFRLSQFVLSEHLRKDQAFEDYVLYPLKIDTDPNISTQQLNNMNKIIEDQYHNLGVKQLEFNQFYTEAKKRAEFIIHQKQIVDKSMQQNQILTAEFIENNENLVSNVMDTDTTITANETDLDEKLLKIQTYISQFQEYSKLIDVLNKDETKPNVSHNNSKQDLIKYFESLAKTLKHNKHLIRERKSVNLSENVTDTTEMLNDLNLCWVKYEELVSNLQLYSAQLEERVNKKYDDNHNDPELSRKVQDIFKQIPMISFSTKTTHAEDTFIS